MAGQVEPTRAELLAMAYVDGELDGAEREAFEARLADESDLRRWVAHYRALEVLARQMAPPEPSDHEWARLEGSPLHHSGNLLGWTLVGAGGATLLGIGLWRLCTDSSTGSLPRLAVLCLVAGFAALLALCIHARVRLLPLDPYRKVQR